MVEMEKGQVMTPQNNTAKPMKSEQEWASDLMDGIISYIPEKGTMRLFTENYIRAIQQDALAAQNDKYQALVAFYDKHVGTPCEQIKHKQELEKYEEVLTDHKRLVREIDVIINGEEGAARQASLCDLVGQIKALASRGDDPRLLPELPDGWRIQRLEQNEDDTWFAKLGQEKDIRYVVVDWYGYGTSPRAAVLEALEEIKE